MNIEDIYIFLQNTYQQGDICDKNRDNAQFMTIYDVIRNYTAHNDIMTDDLCDLLFDYIFEYKFMSKTSRFSTYYPYSANIIEYVLNKNTKYHMRDIYLQAILNYSKSDSLLIYLLKRPDINLTNTMVHYILINKKKDVINIMLKNNNINLSDLRLFIVNTNDKADIFAKFIKKSNFKFTKEHIIKACKCLPCSKPVIYELVKKGVTIDNECLNATCSSCNASDVKYLLDNYKLIPDKDSINAVLKCNFSKNNKELTIKELINHNYKPDIDDVINCISRNITISNLYRFDIIISKRAVDLALNKRLFRYFYKCKFDKHAISQALSLVIYSRNVGYIIEFIKDNNIKTISDIAISLMKTFSINYTEILEYCKYSQLRINNTSVSYKRSVNILDIPLYTQNIPDNKNKKYDMPQKYAKYFNISKRKAISYNMIKKNVISHIIENNYIHKKDKKLINIPVKLKKLLKIKGKGSIRISDIDNLVNLFYK